MIGTGGFGYRGKRGQEYFEVKRWMREREKESGSRLVKYGTSKLRVVGSIMVAAKQLKKKS